MRPVPKPPTECKPGEAVAAHLVRDWPEMTPKQAVAFRNWTGKRLQRDSKLVRDAASGRIFEVSDSDRSYCLWMTTREF